ncbi:MAG: hypothetical protein ACI9G1_003377 [Pirellulaceae bacterium]|jgi:hypothetical protein
MSGSENTETSNTETSNTETSNTGSSKMKVVPDDLRDYVESLRVESAANVLGAGGENKLFSSIGMATLVIAVLLVIGTLVPYMFSEKQTTVKPAEAPAEVEPVAPEEGAAAAATGTAADPATPSDADAARAATALGIDETKTADPAKNPLEKDLDNLLDNIK